MKESNIEKWGARVLIFLFFGGILAALYFSGSPEQWHWRALIFGFTLRSMLAGVRD